MLRRETKGSRRGPQESFIQFSSMLTVMSKKRSSVSGTFSSLVFRLLVKRERADTMQDMQDLSLRNSENEYLTFMSRAARFYCGIMRK